MRDAKALVEAWRMEYSQLTLHNFLGLPTACTRVWATGASKRAILSLDVVQQLEQISRSEQEGDGAWKLAWLSVVVAPAASLT